MQQQQPQRPPLVHFLNSGALFDLISLQSSTVLHIVSNHTVLPSDPELTCFFLTLASLHRVPPPWGSHSPFPWLATLQYSYFNSKVIQEKPPQLWHLNLASLVTLYGTSQVLCPWAADVP